LREQRAFLLPENENLVVVQLLVGAGLEIHLSSSLASHIIVCGIKKRK